MTCLWFKHYDGMIDDPKWDVIAEIADVPLELVSFTFAKLCEYASKAPERGSIAGFDARLVSARLRRPREVIERIIDGMREIDVIVGDRLGAWAERQGGEPLGQPEPSAKQPSELPAPSRAAQRMRKHRREQRQTELLLPMEGGGSVTPSVTEASPVREQGVTPCVTRARTRRNGSVTNLEHQSLTSVTRAPLEERESDKDSSPPLVPPSRSDCEVLDSRTEGIKKAGDLLRRCAPPAQAPCDGVKALKRRHWLDSLSRFAATLEYEAAMGAWELIEEARAGPLPRERKKQLDALDAFMRAKLENEREERAA